MQVDVPNPKTPPPGPSGILTPEETPAKRPHLQGQNPTMAHSAEEMQMAPSSNPGAAGQPVEAMDTQAINDAAEGSQASATGQGQTGAGHALTQILRAPGYPTGGSNETMKVRHRVPIQLEPEVPRSFFYQANTIDGSSADAPYNSNQTFLFSGWLAIPVSSIGLYMNDKEITRMYRQYMAYRYLSAGVRMSNFQTHSVLPTGQDTPGFALNNSGVTFYSVQMSSKQLNYPWLLGSQQYPLSAVTLSGTSMSQIPVAFDDGDGTTRSPEYNLRPRNIMPTGWWLWWLARVDTASHSGYTPSTAKTTASMNGYSVIPDLQRLALEQQNSPAHAAWFYRFRAEKQWRSRCLIAQVPTQLFVSIAANGSVKANSVFINSKYTRRDINVPHTSVNPASLGSEMPIYAKNYGMMVSGMQARGPPTWNSFYERIFNIDDVPMQKYGDAWTFTDATQNAGKNLLQTNFGVNGQGYGIQGIKDLWAIAWRVPNDPSGQPVPLTIEFVMETQIDVEVKHFDADSNLDGIICRPGDNPSVHTDVDTQSLSMSDYGDYLKNRAHIHSWIIDHNARNGMMISNELLNDMPRNFMKPQSSFAQHVALESDNFLTRLDGCVNPGGQSNYGMGFEGQNALNRSKFPVQSIIDMSNNTNNIDNLNNYYHGSVSAFVAP